MEPVYFGKYKFVPGDFVNFKGRLAGFEGQEAPGIAHILIECSQEHKFVSFSEVYPMDFKVENLGGGDWQVVVWEQPKHMTPEAKKRWKEKEFCPAKEKEKREAAARAAQEKEDARRSESLRNIFK